MRYGSFYLSAFVVVVLLAGCSRGGLTKSEEALVMEKTANEMMDLYVVNNQCDSIILRQKARNLKSKDVDSEQILYLKNRMLATVKNPENLGVGIAAPQVGVSLKMIYVQRFDKKGYPFEIIFNPEIKALGDSTKTGWEGCLSVPGFRGEVNRAQSIELSYLDSLGTQKIEKINGFTAVIFQHEIDHINGILYYDHVEDGFSGLTVDNEY